MVKVMVPDYTEGMKKGAPLIRAPLVLPAHHVHVGTVALLGVDEAQCFLGDSALFQETSLDHNFESVAGDGFTLVRDQVVGPDLLAIDGLTTFGVGGFA